MVEVNISKNEAGQRFDKFLFKYLNAAPKSFVYKMLRKKNIVLNGKKSTGDEKLCEGDSVKLFLADETIEKFRESKSANVTNIPSISKKDIIFEDDDILLINKKAGILSQKAEAKDVSINEMMISYLVNNNKVSKESLNTFKPSVCNRLDRNTTGLIACGKSLIGLQELSRLFKDRDIDKYYITLVKGVVNEEKSIEGYLHKDEKTNKVSIHSSQIDDSEYIKTTYIPLGSFKYKNIEGTLLKVKLHTGKPHQIRAHLSSINHPIFGDTKYGCISTNNILRADFNIKYQLLHSYSLTFPKEDLLLEKLKEKTFIAPIPNVYKKVLEGGNLWPLGIQEDLEVQH